MVTSIMDTTLELAMKKAATLPEAAQERIGRDLLEYLRRLGELRAELEIGVRELDAGLGEELDVEKLLGEARSEFDGGS